MANSLLSGFQRQPVQGGGAAQPRACLAVTAARVVHDMVGVSSIVMEAL